MGYLEIKLDRDELNFKLGGSLPENSLILLEGNDGGGKSIISQRLSYALLEHKHKVTYISTELNTVEFVSQMKSVNYDILEHLLDENLLFIPMFPFYGKTILNESFMDELFDSKKIFDNEVIVIDTLSYLLFKNSQSCDYFDIINFFKKLLGLGKTLIVCIEPSQVPKEFLNLIQGICDIYMKVEVRDYLGNIVNFIDIIRYKRALNRIEKRIPFRVDPQIGIAIEIAA
jgi:flagellar protein FlaH